MVTRGITVRKVVVDGAQEPVTLEDLKSHLAIDFEDWDPLLEEFLLSAREEVESYTGLSLVESNITARWEELTTRELPYGPVKSVTSVQDKDDVDLTCHTLEGLDFKTIKANSCSPTVVKYLAGFDEVPAGLRLAIMKLATDHFTNRTAVSMEQYTQKLPNDWKSVAKRFSRKTWIA
jgi:uncharacterized phiE125 gp8 family phage protein